MQLDLGLAVKCWYKYPWNITSTLIMCRGRSSQSNFEPVDWLNSNIFRKIQNWWTYFTFAVTAEKRQIFILKPP